MRISDWSSDVCSSDLSPVQPAGCCRRRLPTGRRRGHGGQRAWPLFLQPAGAGRYRTGRPADGGGDCAVLPAMPAASRQCHCRRSEEHTSELQSLMRNSYAVFCLKKKINNIQKKKKKIV